MTTVAVITAKDAATSIAATVQAVGRLRGVDEVWVVDDGSVDDTATRAHGAGASVLRLERNVGKGGALAAGVNATPQATRYLLADADLGATASGLQPLLDAEGDLVIGQLPSADGRGGFGFVKRFARAGIRRASGFDGAAPLSGQRVVDGARLRGLVLAPRFGVEVGATIDVVRGGGTVVEVPVDVDHHHTGRSWRGFVHRAGQGRDIAGALLVRLTTQLQRIAAVGLTALLVFLALSAASVSAAPASGAALPQADRVLLFGFDRLSLADVERSDLPTLRALWRSAATGALNVRTTDRRTLQRRSGSERPSPFDAYASLGASARVRSVRALAAAGVGPSGVPAPAMAAARDQARDDRAAHLPGALGDALRAAGKRTGLVAAAELIDSSTTMAGIPAAAAIADASGRIDHVDVSQGLLEPAPNASVGLQSSTEGFLRATATALRAADVVLVDPGDAARAADADRGAAARTAALRHTDEVLGAILAARPAGTAVVVFAPTPSGTDWALTPVIVGDGLRGTISSESTHRASLGVLADLAPTTLRLLGLAPDEGMTGAALRSTPGRTDLGALRRFGIDGAVRSRFFLPAAVGYTVAAVVFYLGLIAAVRRRIGPPWRTALRVGSCVAAAFPLAILVTGAMQHWLHAGGESPLLLVLVCGALGLGASARPGLRPVFTLAALTLAVIAVDVAVTGPIHAASILGYSLQNTGRFYGLPNASTSVFAASLFLFAAGAVGPTPTAVRRAAGVAVLGVGALFVAAPWLGNDVGGTITLIPIGAATAWCFLGNRLTPRVAVAGAALTALAISAYVAGGALIGSGHLARAAAEGASDNSSITNTLAHRWDANVGLLVSQWWGFLCIALALFGLERLTRRRRFQEFLPLGSPLRVAAVAVLATSLLAFAVNDSGPVVMVLCFVVLAPALAMVALDGPSPEPSVPA